MDIMILTKMTRRGLRVGNACSPCYTDSGKNQCELSFRAMYQNILLYVGILYHASTDLTD